MLWTPGYFGCWGCSGSRDVSDAGGALDLRGLALTPPARLGYLQSSVPWGSGAPPSSSVPDFCCCCSQRQQGEAEQPWGEYRDAPSQARPWGGRCNTQERGKVSLPQQRCVQRARGCVWAWACVCVQVPARLLPADLWCTEKDAEMPIRRRWGWGGGEEEMKWNANENRDLV